MKACLKLMFAAVLLAGFVAPLMADAQSSQSSQSSQGSSQSARDRIWGNHPPKQPPGHHPPGRPNVPEFDPAAAGAVAALLAGGGLVLARRRKPAR